MRSLITAIKQRLCRHTEIEQISAIKVRCKRCGREFILYQIGQKTNEANKRRG